MSRRGLAVVLMMLAVLAAGFVWQRSRSSASTTQSFDVRGVVRGVDNANRTLRVEHEEIPDYMPAMTMSLPVKEPAALQGLREGDAITFRLEVTSDDSWISKIEKSAIGAPGRVAPEKTQDTASAEAKFERVQLGGKVPDFTIVDETGRARSLSDFRGKAVLVSFIYTRCPLPNFCPLLSRKFAEMQQVLTTNVPGKFHLLSITIDPEHDTPDVLRSYAANWRKDVHTWTFGTAKRAEIEVIAGYFGLIHERTPNGAIDHDLRTALIDPQGRLVHVWKSNFWKREEVLQRVAEL